MIIHRLYLTAEERQTLEGWQKKYKKQSPKLRQIQIVLNSDEATGRRAAGELAPVLGVSTRTIERVRCQFCAEGMGMFEPKFYAHFPPEVAQAYLRRMEIIYTPAHGSWLNRAELEFSVLSRQVLDQSFSSAEQVRRVVDRWVARQNAKTQPRNWQFTTADARIKLAKLYPTI